MPFTVRCPNPACRRDLVVPDLEPVPGACPQCGVVFPPAADFATRPPPDPVRIGRFVVKAKLGAGAFGTVYRAYDPNLDREVAVKVPNREAVSDPVKVERFLREAKAAAGLRHPNIVPVYDAGRDGDRYFIAAAFIDGQPLNEAIPETGVDFRRAAELVKELAEALAYAHDQGIVHRDVKPHNCMLDRKGHLHLMDFGLARRGDDAPDAPTAPSAVRDSRLTNDGALLGTPLYMAPEQAGGKAAEVGPAADQYAAGVVLYQLLTGATPFGGPPEVVVYNLLNREPDPPSKARRGVPRDLERVCRRAMAKKPGDRYRSCRRLADDLRRWLDGEPVAGRELTEAEKLVRWVTRRPTAAASALLGVAVVVLIVFVSFARGLAERDRQARGFAEEAAREEATARRAAEADRDRENGKRLKAEAARDDANKKRLAADLDLDAERVRAADRDGRLKTATADLAAGRRTAAETYARLVGLAGRERRAADGDRAAALLALCDPALRGWEWHALARGGPRPAVRPAARELVTFKADNVTPQAGAFSPDGALVLVTSQFGPPRVWDAGTGKESRRLHDRTLGLHPARFDPDWRRALTGGEDGSVKVLDTASGATRLTLKRENTFFQDSAFSPDGRRVLTRSFDGARVWDADTGAQVAVLDESSNAAAVFRADGSGFVGHGTAYQGNKPVAWVQVWDADGRPVRKFDVPAGDAPPVFSPDGRRALTTGRDGTSRTWDTAAGTERAAFRTGPRTAAAFSPDGGRVLTVSAAGTVQVWEADTGAALAAVRPDAADSYRAAVTAGFSPDGGRVVTTNGGRAAQVWDAVGGHELAALAGHASQVMSAAFSPDGSRVVTASYDQTARVWDVRPVRGRRAGFTPDGTRVVWTDPDGKAFGVPVADPAAAPEPATAPPPPLLATPDKARELVLAGGRLRLRGTATGLDVFAFPEPDVTDASFSPDGHRVVTVTKDGALRVWDGRPEAPAPKP